MAPSVKKDIQEVIRVNAAMERRSRWINHNRFRREAELVIESIHERRVCFYPSGSYDWNAILHLSDLCDTFIFCDWCGAAERVTGEFKVPGLSCDSIYLLHNDTVAYLSDPALLPANIMNTVKGFGPPPVEPWGKYASLTRTVGDVVRPIHFFYLGMEGITAFFNLFIPERVAPEVICLKHRMGRNSEHFHKWNGLLGQLVQNCEIKPTHVVGVGGPDSDWPYPRLWRHIDGWSDIWMK